MLVVEENTQTFVITTQRLDAKRLLSNVENWVREQNVPVEAKIVQARWQNDLDEKRDRVVASLRGHRFSDIKMLLGVDYMGNWASVHYVIAIEPDPHPIPPAEPLPFQPPDGGPPYGFVMLGIGLFIAWVGSSSNSGLAIFFGVLLFFVGIIAQIIISKSQNDERARLQMEWHSMHARRQNEWEMQQARLRHERNRMRSARTFKDDDIKLFATCMETIFKVIVSDIERDLGGRLVQVKAVRGGEVESRPSNEQATVADPGI